jgi:gluconate 2-dehydrogenase gamma chain
MNKTGFSRRSFLSTVGDAARGSCIALSLPMILAACDRAQQARLNAEDFQVLSLDEALEFNAIAARIIPSDTTPGASDAGVVYFIDTVLANGREAELAILRAGLQSLQATTSASHNSALFHVLNADQQDQILTGIEQTEFFSTIRFLTIAGTFSHPEYGGNRDQVGYRILGFEDRHVWQPPFGFYDADYTEKGE